MTVLLTIFGISLFGIIYMLLFQHAEIKSGKKLFLPHALHERDETIQQWFQRMHTHAYNGAARGVEVSRHVVITGVRHTGRSIKRLHKHVSTKLAPKRILTKTQDASRFIQDMKQHKDSLQNDTSLDEKVM